MAGQTSPFSIYESLFRDFLYNYNYLFSPMLKAFSPTFYFGCNVQDEDVEHHVLSKVGSYGSQINRILDALNVLVSQVDEKSLTPQEADDLRELRKLADAADRASTEFEKKPPSGLTRDGLDRTLNDLRSLARQNPALYDEFVDRLRRSLPQPAAVSSAEAAQSR